MLVAQIDKLEDRVFQHLFELSPRTGVSLGLHEYDGNLPDVSRAKIRDWSSKAWDLLEQVRAVDRTLVDHDRRLDIIRLESLIERTLFEVEELRSYSSRPNPYTFQLSTVPYVSREYAPIDTRIKALNQHLKNVPSFLEQARQNLDRTLPRPIADVSVAQATGSIRDLEGQAFSEVAKASQTIQNEFQTSSSAALDSIREFVEDLKKRSSTSEFAIGQPKFRQILWINDKIKDPLEDVLQLGLDDLESNLAQLWETGEKLGPGKKIEDVIDSIQLAHPRPENLVSETSAMLEDLKRFVNEKQIVSMPAKTDCRVVPTPALMRATTTAAMNSPGPFEKEGLEGFYYVTPVEDDWDEKKKEEWRRHLNHTTLQNISMHEVYPGHYTHRLFLNSFGKSKTQKSYWNTTFGEGWAHYTEELMLDRGYGDSKLRLMELKEALLRDCSFIVSIRMHTQGMSVDQATTFIMENAFMTETTARREALRGTFDYSYYGYTLGKLFIKRARKGFYQAHPSAPIKTFHDKLLSLGPAPVGLLEDLIMV